MSQQSFKRAFESVRLKISEDLNQLIDENGMTRKEIAKRLRITTKRLRKWIYTDDIRLSQLIKLLDVIRADLYPIMRNRQWTQAKVMEKPQLF